MKYAFIQQRMNEANNIHRLMTFCRVLEVSRSGFYEWVERSAQPDPDAALRRGILAFTDARRETKGSGEGDN